jgi:hypothetical protein
VEGREKPHMVKYKAIMNDWNYDASCTLTSLLVWDLGNFKRLVFVVQNVQVTSIASVCVVHVTETCILKTKHMAAFFVQHLLHIFVQGIILWIACVQIYTYIHTCICILTRLTAYGGGGMHACIHTYTHTHTYAVSIVRIHTVSSCNFS